MSEKEMLKEWTLQDIKTRDLFFKRINSIEENKNGFDLFINKKTGDSYYAIIPFITSLDEIMKDIGDRQVNIIVLNTKENIDKLIKKWEEAIKHRNLCFLFVNPKINGGRKWFVYPYNHELILEPGTLKQSLMVLFKTVDEWK